MSVAATRTIRAAQQHHQQDNNRQCPLPQDNKQWQCQSRECRHSSDRKKSKTTRRSCYGNTIAGEEQQCRTSVLEDGNSNITPTCTNDSCCNKNKYIGLDQHHQVSVAATLALLTCLTTTQSGRTHYPFCCYLHFVLLVEMTEDYFYMVGGINTTFLSVDF